MDLVSVRYTYPTSPVVNVTNVNDSQIGFTFEDGTTIAVLKSQVAVVTPVQSGLGVASPYVECQVTGNTPINVSVNATEPNMGTTTAAALADAINVIIANGYGTVYSDPTYAFTPTTGSSGVTIDSYSSSLSVIGSMVTINFYIIMSVTAGSTEANISYTIYVPDGMEASMQSVFSNLTCRNTRDIYGSYLSDVEGGGFTYTFTNDAISTTTCYITGFLTYGLT